jgi:predicted phage gp36 major capsid-like protein
MTIAEVKAHEEKISAQLHEAKALLEEFEAHARKNKAQAEIAKITGLKAKKQEIEKKLQQLAKTGAEAKAAVQIKADIEAEVAKLKTSLGEIATRLKSKSSTN